MYLAKEGSRRTTLSCCPERKLFQTKRKSWAWFGATCLDFWLWKWEYTTTMFIFYIRDLQCGACGPDGALAQLSFWFSVEELIGCPNYNVVSVAAATSVLVLFCLPFFLTNKLFKLSLFFTALGLPPPCVRISKVPVWLKKLWQQCGRSYTEYWQST